MFKKFALAASVILSLTATLPQMAMADDSAQDTAMAQALAALDAAMPGKLINNPYDIKWRTDGSDKKEAVVNSDGVPGGVAYQVRVKKTKPNAWDTATRVPMTTSIEKDDVILVSFWARAAKLQKGKTAGNISVALQRNVSPYDAIFEEPIAPTSEWKLYSFSGTAARDYAADKTNLNFNLAKAKQTIEFGPFYIMSLGAGADASKYITP